MMRGILALGATLLGAGAALAQSGEEMLPRQPALGPDPAAAVTPDAAQQDVEPAFPGGGPSFVLRGIAVEGNTAVPTAQLSPIWADLIGQSVTLSTLDGIVARISAAYRERGYVLSQAALPAQTIEDGVVSVVVVEGFVDSMTVSGGAPNQNRLARKALADVARERPLRLRTLERGVLLSRDTFGSVYGGSVETVLEPSPDTFGAADLGVLITPEPVSGYVTADNRGSRLYGALTLGAGVRSYNLLGLNERLDGIIAFAPQDAALTFGQLVVDVPIEPLFGTFLDGARLELGASASRGDPDLEESGSPEGLTTIVDQAEVTARLVVPFIRSRSQNLYGRLGLSFSNSESETDFAGATIEEVDRLAVLEARGTWDFADGYGGVNLVDLGLRQGLDVGSVTLSAEGPAAGVPDFTAVAMTLSRLQSVGDGAWSVYGEIIGQYTPDILPSAERFYLGESTIGRGFAPGNTSGDSGYAGRVELRRYIGAEALPAVIEAAEIYAYADYGRAYDRSISRDGDQWESLGSVGLGARIDLGQRLSITPEIARQVDGIPTDTRDPDLETRFYLGVVSRF